MRQRQVHTIQPKLTCPGFHKGHPVASTERVCQHTYRHAIERELSVDFKLIRCRQPPAGVQQHVVELEAQAEVCGKNGSSPGSDRASGLSLPIGYIVPGHQGQTAGPTHQEEHALLEPLPRELAEAAQADELLRSRQGLSLPGV